MKKILIVLMIFTILSCGVSKNYYPPEEITGIVTEIETPKRFKKIQHITVDKITYSCSYTHVKVGDSVKINYQYMLRNNKRNVLDVEVLK